MPYNHKIFHIPKIKDGKELKEIYLSVAIRAFALSIISIFVPLYLLELGHSFNEVLVFLLIFFTSAMIISPFIGKLSTFLGVKHAALTGPFVTMAYLLLLLFLPSTNIPLPIIAVVGAIGAILYWIPINSHFAKHSHKKQRGKETSYLAIVSRTVAIIGPLAGGLIITLSGFNIAFIIACLLMLIAVLPLFLSYEYKSKFKYKFSQMFSRKNLPFFDDFVFHGVLVVVSIIIFPIYIYTISSNYEITGGMATLTGVGIAISAFVMGKYSDRKGKIKMMRVGGVLSLALWITLMVFKAPAVVYISSFFVGLVGYSITIPLMAFFCDKLKKHEHTEFMTFREIGLAGGKALVLFILLFFSSEAKFTIAFALAAIASIYFIFADLD